MSTLFTDVEAAIEEGHFLQNDFNQTAYLIVSNNNQLFVITEDQYGNCDWKSHKILEIFQATRSV